MISTGPLLRTGTLTEYHPVGAVGHPVYLAAAQLRAALARRLGPDLADVFAVPQRNQDGDTIDWYAPRPGSVVPWSSASTAERAAAKEQLLANQERIDELARTMQSDPDTQRQVFGRLLAHVLNFPGEEHVYLVDGRPVLTFWGFVREADETGADPLVDLERLGVESSGRPMATLVEGVLNSPPAPSDPTSEPASPRRRGILAWLWLPLLLLLLALLLLFLLRGCEPVARLIPFGQVDPEPTVSEDIKAPMHTDATTPVDGSETTMERTWVSESDRHGKVEGLTWTDRDGVTVAGDSVLRDEGAAGVTDPTLAEPRSDLAGAAGERDTALSDVDSDVAGATGLGDAEPVPSGLEEPAPAALDDGGSTNPASDVVGDEALPHTDAEAPTDQDGEAVPLSDDSGDPMPTGEPEAAESATAGDDKMAPPPEDADASVAPPLGGDALGAAPAEDPDQSEGESSGQPQDESATPGPDLAGGEGGEGRGDRADAVGGRGTSIDAGAAGLAPALRGLSRGWKTATALQDPKTGLPVHLEYQSQGDAGQLRLKRHDGSVCLGVASAKSDGGRLSIESGGELRCADGTNFGRPRVECELGKDGQPRCLGRYPGGAAFPIDIRAQPGG